MKVGWQILTPPLDWDLGSTGEGPSSGRAFWTSYNTEMAHDVLEVNSSQKDRDLCAVVNWRAAEKAVADGKSTMMDGVPIIDPPKVPGVLYFVPIGKSPHGIDVDPPGKWIVAGGKLQPATTVLNFEKVQTEINNKTFEGDFRGIPILKYEAVVEGEVPVGLGPLHTQFDGKGFAYTSMFIDSNITKWKLPPWTNEEKKDLNKAVLDKVPAHFSTGHLVVAGSDTKNPYGKWLVAMNKLSAGRDNRSARFFAQAELKSRADFTPEKTATNLDLHQGGIFRSALISAHEKNSYSASPSHRARLRRASLFRQRLLARAGSTAERSNHSGRRQNALRHDRF